MMPSVLFRADASQQIGSGHVMRCLVLADALSKAGWHARFVCRDVTGHQAERIRARGYDVALLAQASSRTSDNQLAHSHWLPVSQQEDAQQTVAQLAGAGVTWIIVDHYALDAQWERLLQPHCKGLMALDDLADRHHCVDLLLDQNAGRQASDYDGWLATETTRLIGPGYALLAPPFAEIRDDCLRRRHNRPLHRLLITMGGVDKDNATGRVLAEIARLDPPDLEHIDVVLGASAPHKASIEQQLSHFPIPHALHIDTPRMAELMCKADLAVGASGGTNWERCCLGLPTILCTLAENQTGSAAALAESGAAITTGDPGADPWAQRFADAMTHIRTQGALKKMAGIAENICDGLGAARVSCTLMASLVQHRPAAADDAENVWRWRRADNAARFYKSAEETALQDHLIWFSHALADPNRIFLIFELDGDAIGYVRFDLHAKQAETVTLSICLAPEMKGRKLGRIGLDAAIEHSRTLGLTTLVAEIHRGNAPSIRLFEGSGFRAQETKGSFTSYRLTIDPPPSDHRPQRKSQG